jgi:ATP-dependent Lon protease
MKQEPTYGLFPVLPIRNTVIFPGTALPLRVGRPGSVSAMEKAIQGEGWILTVTQKNDKGSKDPTSRDLFHVGTLCHIEKVRGNANDGFQVLVRGVARFRVNEYTDKDGRIEAQADLWPDQSDMDEATKKALLDSLKSLSKEILDLLPANTDQLSQVVDGIEDLAFLSHLCAANLEIPLEKKQEILETVGVKSRVLQLLGLMQSQKENLQVQSEIRSKLSNRMDKMQRDAILREQMKAIQEELGEGEDSPAGENYDKKIADAGMPDEVKKAALHELRRLKTIGSGSPEAHIIRNYLDLLCAMPWNKAADSNIDLDAAREQLEKDHYGLQDIKKRILQHLAVMKLKPGGKGSILLLVGPPGVGKTSIGQSIAKALGRKFVRASLGGVRDDAEIRGHRRTYVGAMPGRIVQGIKRAGEKNPVLMLDEIDKLSRSFQGDPASALLEVLDPEQNQNFLDHYLDVPFDLSQVMFIATANTVESIPGPLLDRMEVIELSGYTTAEKLHIAKRHLLPKVLEEHGMDEAKLTISDEALLRVISHYTREAGARDLQRKLAAICRGESEKIVKATEFPIKVEATDLEDLLGPEKYTHEVAERLAPPGVVTGLAWTPQGGEILFIETTAMQGSGKLIITGQLGDVMKESAQIALSLVRSKLNTLVPGFDFEKKDIHIHVPAGAIPKDGPSAGVTMFTSIASLFSGRNVDPKLAMTGEISLRGAVMPVGGIKEKVIAAHRAGIERILLCSKNKKDLRDVPDDVKSQLKIDFVDDVTQILKLALGIDANWMNPTLGTPPPSPTAAA